MKLSVIIVNYNVKYFLEQCLYSVEKSLQGIESEIIVIDNNSVDGSEAMVRNKFSRVDLIINDHNAGFSKANNQALKIARGEYVLLLNPDTVVEETTFTRCLDFMDAHPTAGAMGPKMIDGKGRYLPESKRALPTPVVAFYKVFGLSKIFPRSKRFGKYYLGYTNQDEIQEIEVLTGAFMFIRHIVLQEVGLLDEDFFMYGEDIDLSYRIREKGYKIYYFPETTIIHYKGESTRKDSLTYLTMFYKAMKIFAEKHFSSNRKWMTNSMINVAINMRAGFSLLNRIFINILPFILDAISGFIGLYFLSTWWAVFHFHNVTYFSGWFIKNVIPSYIFVWLLSVYILGGYKKPFNLRSSIFGVAAGTTFILLVYAILPEYYRFSRVLILFGTLWMLFSQTAVRFLLYLTGKKEYHIFIKRKHRIVIVGTEDESQRVEKILEQSGILATKIVKVFPGKTLPSEYFSGNLIQLSEIIRIYGIDEVIFCARDVSSEQIIEQMKLLIQTKVNFKIASPGSKSVIGSNSSGSSGDLYVVSVKRT